MTLTCPKCGSHKMTTGVKALSAQLLDWFHKCLDCGEVIWIGLRHDPRPADLDRAERRAELPNLITVSIMEGVKS